jgi:hypothetical protein
MFTTGQAPRVPPAILAIMSGSLHPKEIHRRQHRREKRHKLRAQLGAAPAIGRAAIEAKLQKTYAFGCGPQQSKSGAHDAAPVPVTPV